MSVTSTETEIKDTFINNLNINYIMKKILTILIVLAMVAAVTATVVLFLFPDQPPETDDSGSTQSGIQQVVNANNEFTFDFYSEINKKEGNIFYSPYSISAALAMTYEGAKGQTAEEMKSVFHFPESNILRPNFAAIYNNLNKKGKEYKLSTGNALWAQQDYQFLPEYLSRVEKYYGGKAANLDFVGESEKSRQTINSFIEQQTNYKIKDLISQGVLNAYTRLVLTNAIYFKGTWVKQFDKKYTRDKDFTTISGQKVKTPMMQLTGGGAKFNYADLGELQILELPYKGEDVSMLILLPKQGKDYDFETREIITSDYTLDDIELSSDKLNEYKSQMQETKLDYISIPKFEFDTKYFMKDTLSVMGMPTAFTDRADFSGMTGKEDLLISFVIHQAYVKVDEEGTEAAAATAVGGIKLTSVSLRKEFRADHPFIFIIQEKETGNILFMGRVADPTK